MRVPALLGLLGLAVCAAASARASGDLTGTYAGSLSCRLAGGTVSATPSIVAISERAAQPEVANLILEVDGVRYAGRAANGDAAFRQCGAINPAYGEPATGFEQVSYRADATTGATVLHFASRSEFGLCEATWTRIDASDPRIAACGE
jgi:hypothetical protein